MKGSHQLSELKNLYAKEKGIALRTAQLHAKQSAPDWLAFVARTAGAAYAAPNPSRPQAEALVARSVQIDQAPPPHVVPAAAPPAMAKAAHLRTVEEHAECECWEAFCAASDQRRAAIAAGDVMLGAGFVKIATEALKSYHAARAKRITSEIEAGRLQPVSAWHAVKSGLSKIANLIAGLPEIAALANPDKPHLARQAIVTWLETRFDPQVKFLVEEAQTVISAAA